MALALDAAAECLTPTSLGPPHVSGYLWMRPGKGGAWKRRYAVCCANFMLWFAEKDAERPTKPLGALCFEDLVVAPLEPAPTEKEVAQFASNAFSIAPRADDHSKATGSVFSGASGRRVHFCVETEQEEVAWRTALMVWRHATLTKDREQLSLARDELHQSREAHRTEVQELQHQLEAMRQFAESQRAAASAAQEHAGRLEQELHASESALLEARCAPPARRLRRQVAKLPLPSCWPRAGCLAPPDACAHLHLATSPHGCARIQACAYACALGGRPAAAPSSNARP